jgi:hypothetical protein
VTPARPGTSWSLGTSETSTSRPSAGAIALPADPVPFNDRKGAVSHSSRDANHPASSAALATDAGWWRTQTPVSCDRKPARAGSSKLDASRSRHGVVRSQARSTT